MPCDYVSFLCVKKLFKLLSDYSNCHFKLIYVNKTQIPGDSHLDVWLQKGPNWMCGLLRQVQHFLKEPVSSSCSWIHGGRQTPTPFGSSPWTRKSGYTVLYNYLEITFPLIKKKWQREKERVEVPRSLTSKLYNKNRQSITWWMHLWRWMGKKRIHIASFLQNTVLHQH